jgi:pimeloyl-ACP methyl ester carboxylesterase
MKLIANGIQIEVDDSGQPGDSRPAVLLIMGLGMQLIAWPPHVVQPLLDAGYRVLRHDNRDIGLSQHFDHLGTPNLVWASVKHRLGLQVRAPYTVQDMADDAAAVLAARGVARAHIVGISMGGMIAQRLAVSAPQLVQSLTLIMTSSGARGLPGPQPQVLRHMLSRPARATPDAILAHGEKLMQLIGSPGYPNDPAYVRQRLQAAMARSFHPSGVLRQMVAIGADSQRPALLGHIKAPTLVLHGDADPLVPLACGRDVARRIGAAARLVTIPGMGHDLPPGAVDQWLPHLLEHMADHADQADAPGAAGHLAVDAAPKAAPMPLAA